MTKTTRLNRNCRSVFLDAI